MEIVLARHGETEWSRDLKHTGRTDIPLTDRGRAEAEQLGWALAGRSFAGVLSSPLQRAVETCRLAGLGDQVELSDDLLEWDYGDAALFAHGHVLRVLTARWLALGPESGALFKLDTGTLSSLGFERETPVITRWNSPVSAA